MNRIITILFIVAFFIVGILGFRSEEFEIDTWEGDDEERF